MQSCYPRLRKKKKKKLKHTRTHTPRYCVCTTYFLNGRRLSDLQEADLDRQSPSEQVAEEGRVAKRDDVRHFPEDGASVAVEVRARWDVLHVRAGARHRQVTGLGWWRRDTF
jgi:hypothetical protein